MGNDIGFRVFKNVERVSADVLEAFRGIPASNIAEGFTVRTHPLKHLIKPLFWAVLLP